MSIALYIVLAFIAGGAVGYALHAWIAEEAAATKSEIADWIVRIRGAIITDEKTAKAKISKIADELEGKL